MARKTGPERGDISTKVSAPYCARCQQEHERECIPLGYRRTSWNTLRKCECRRSSERDGKMAASGGNE